MPISHIAYNHSSPHGHQMAQALQDLDNGLDRLQAVKATMALMIDGDGTNVSHFTQYIVDKYGFADAATAKASWDEINSLLFKLTTNDSVSSVNAAYLQAINKHR
jgi:hypothetical protein